MPHITRFAPSPTGRLHLGHAHSAAYAHRAAGGGGLFLLRIEDIDSGRCRPEFETGIREDLGWLGLSWAEPVRRQSDHFDDYKQALDRLGEAGLLYPCFCTRKDIAREIARAGAAPHGPDGPLYPGTCRAIEPALAADRLATGESHALRLRTNTALARTGPLRWFDRLAGWQQARPDSFGDIVLARKDIPASYHLAVTWDDAVQEVSLVTRGSDLFASSHIHRLLQALLDLPVPDWSHHRLLTDAAGRRFAKRDRSITIADLRAQGRSPRQVLAMAGINAV